jgi:hypothetical protein
LSNITTGKKIQHPTKSLENKKFNILQHWIQPKKSQEPKKPSSPPPAEKLRERERERSFAIGFR